VSVSIRGVGVARLSRQKLRAKIPPIGGGKFEHLIINFDHEGRVSDWTPSKQELLTEPQLPNSVRTQTRNLKLSLVSLRFVSGRPLCHVFHARCPRGDRNPNAQAKK